MNNLNYILELFFGNEGVVATLVFMFFTFFGMLWIKIARYNIKKKASLRLDPPIRLKFDWSLWKDDNSLDFILAFMTAFAMFRFFPEALNFIETFKEVPEFTDKMLYGLLLGLGFQYIFHRILNTIKIKEVVDKMNLKK